MNILDGIQNFLQLINDNWTIIVIVVGLIIFVISSSKHYFNKSNGEKLDIAKKQIQETILKLVADAETDYKEWSKSGNIKRSQVIEKIFLTYPILSKVTNQEDLLTWIDEIIDKSLENMKTIFIDKEE